MTALEDSSNYDIVTCHLDGFVIREDAELGRGEVLAGLVGDQASVHALVSLRHVLYYQRVLVLETAEQEKYVVSSVDRVDSVDISVYSQ